MTNTATQAQPTEGQDQQVTTPDPTPPQAAPAVPTPAPGPWANDLAELFPDEAARGSVDQFIRSKVQPYITQLEQKASVSESASRLWSDLETNTVDTYVKITGELFGEEAAAELLQLVQSKIEEQPTTEPATPQAGTPPVDPRIEAMYESFIQKEAQEAYDQGLARIAADPNTQDVDTDLIHPFVAAAGGDFDQAVVMYRQFHEQFQSKRVPSETAEPGDTPPAPAVAGSDTGSAAASTTPVEPKSQTIGEAISDFMDEQRANREAPPVV